MKPDLFDVVELRVDLPEFNLRAGDRGAIVEKHGDCAYEIEFADSAGETLALPVLAPEQFRLVWQSATKTWIEPHSRRSFQSDVEGLVV